MNGKTAMVIPRFRPRRRAAPRAVNGRELQAFLEFFRCDDD